MALVRGVHVIKTANWNNAEQILRSIQRNGLEVNHTPRGIGAYAYYADRILLRREAEPAVVFDIDDSDVQEQRCPLPRNPAYSFMKMGMGKQVGSYVTITILGFLGYHRHTKPREFPLYTTAERYSIRYV